MMFSIVVPVYNCEKYLAECLDSVRNQTCTDWECICVDDGSTDASGKIADAYAAQDVRFRVVHQVNAGVGPARNTGIGISRGDWLCFLDADDIMNVGMLNDYKVSLEENAAADVLAVRSAAFVDGAGPGWNSSAFVERVSYDLKDAISSEVYGISIWRAAYKKDLTMGLEFPALKIGEDRVFIAKFLERATSLVQSEYPGYGYRIRSGSALNTRYNAEKFLHDLRHHVFWVDTFINTKKMYEPCVIHRFAKDFTEYLSSKFFEMPMAEWRKCTDEWFDSLRRAAEYPWPRWPRFVMRICGMTRSLSVVWTLCYLPYWLKAHGVNRGFKIMPKPLVEKADA